MADTDYSKKWHVMSAVGTGVLLSTIDSSIVNIALPTIRTDLDASLTQVQWVSLGYILALTALLLPFGRWGDLTGKKPTYTTGFVVFTAASALCGLAPSVEALIGLRVIQAIGAALVVSVGAAIVTGAFPPTERGKALGVIGTFVSVGIVTGPVLGGFLVTTLSWRWIFLVNVPVGIIGTYLTVRNVRAAEPGARGFDLPGALALGLALSALALGVTTYGSIADAAVIALVVLSAVALAAFVAIERRADNPLIDLRLFKNPLLSVSVVTGLSAFVAIALVSFVLPFYLEESLGFTTQQAGLFMAITPVSLGLVAPLAGSLSDRIGVRTLTLAGLSLQLVGYLAVQALNAESTALHVAAVAVPVGLGIGVFQAPNNSAIMSSAPREYSGVASAVLALTRLLGQMSGIALLGSLWTSSVSDLTDAGAALGDAVVTAIRDSFVWTAGLIGGAVLLAVYGLRKERVGAGHPLEGQATDSTT